MKMHSINVKLKLYSYIKSMFNNKFRFWLTIIGMVVGAMVFLAGTAVLNTFESSYKSAYENFGDEVFYLENQDEFSAESIVYFKNNMPDSIQTYYGSKHGYIDSIGNDNLYITINPVSSNFANNYQISDDFNMLDNHPILEMPSYFEGTIWNENSHDKEIVINEIVSYFYFGNIYPIGKTITLNSRLYKVVGVVSNSHYGNNLLSDYNKNSADNMLPEGKIYMSFNCYKENIGETTIEKAIYKLGTAALCRQNVMSMKSYYRQEIENGQVALTDVAIISESIINKLDEYKTFMTIAIIGILLLSGFVIMNTLFFNVKEKIAEIGIRKAFGASSHSILFQFIFEGAFYGFLAFILGSLIMLGSINIISIFTMFSSFPLMITINVESILYCALIVIAEGIIFSIAPAVYASKLKVVDSLKFE